MIRLYGFEECMACHQVRRLLEKFGIEYEYVDVLKNVDALKKVGVLKSVDVSKKNVYSVSVPVLELDDGTMLKNPKAIAKYLRKEGEKHRAK
ncbi:unnamed protein product, partial [marine sediment metagenome]